MRSRKIFVFLFCLLAAGLFFACNNPLGLGDKVNTEKPVINIPDDSETAPGAFLTGEDNLILLDVKQPYGLSEVYMTVWYYCNDENCDECDADKKIEHELVVPAKQGPDGLWYANIDTTDMTDGKIRTKVTAIDTSSNRTDTIDITYIVKNLPPQIELSIPNVKGTDFDKINLDEWLESDPVVLGFSIMGLATDNLGIKEGYPKIQIWPENHPYVDPITKLPVKTGNPAQDRYTEFYSTIVVNPRPGMTSARFTWPMYQMIENPANPGHYILPSTPEDTRSLNQGNYRFRLEIRDQNDVPNYYPNRYDNPNYTPQDNPKKWMQISYVAADIPVIMIVEPMQQYYNGVGDYVVNLIINSQNPVTDVYSWVTDSSENNPDYTSEKYAAISQGYDGSRYLYKLIIKPEDAAKWQSRPEPGVPQLFLHFEAKDERDKTSPTLFRSFAFDVTPPQVVFERPVSNLPVLAGSSGTMTGGQFVIQYPTTPPRWINGTAIVSGSSLDATSTVAKLYYHIGKLGDDNQNNTARATTYENADWIDTHLDSFIPSNHAEGWSGTVYAWQYTRAFSGDNGFNKTNHGSLVQKMSELNGISGNAFDTEIAQSPNRFYLPFYVKVVDGAGNFQIIHYKLCVDPDLDVPYATITSPAPTIEVPIPIIGGEVRLAGTASDDDWIHSVIVRIKKAGSSSWYIPTTNPPTMPIYGPGSTFPMYDDDPKFGQPGYNEAREGWFSVSKIGDDAVVGWYVNINGDGGLDPESGSESVDVLIEARAVDTKTNTTTKTPDVVGPSTVFPVVFSAGAPRISNPKIVSIGVPDRDYYEGIDGSGSFKITSTLSDDKGLLNIKVKFNGIDYQLISNGSLVPNPNAVAAGISITRPEENSAHDDRVESILTIDVDTINNEFYTANFGYGRTGYLDIDISVQDNSQSPMTARGIYKVGVDNFYPTTTIETQFNASSVRRDEIEGIAGRKFELSGMAKDYGDTSGSIQDISRVLIFFQEAEIQYISGVSTIVAKSGGAFMNQRGVKVGGIDEFYGSGYIIPPMITYPNVRVSSQTTTGSGAWGTSMNWFPDLVQTSNPDPNIGWVWQSPHAMVIDNAESDAWLDIDKDGTFGEVWSGLVDKTWRAFIDTEYFNDGPLMVHYIVMDQAGNATRYEKGIYVENKKPEIVNLNFGTNFKGSAATTGWTSPEVPGDFMRDNYTVGITTAGNRIINFEPQFRIRGAELAMRLETRYGNGALNYEVSYVTPLPRMSADKMKRGEVYTIETPGTTDWQKFGAINNSRQTTFVASGPGDGTGFVVPYTKVRTEVGAFADKNPTVAAGKTTINNTTVFKGSAHFETIGSGNRIPDSPKTSGEINRRPIAQRANWPSDWEIAWPEQLFIVKVYDTTVSGAAIKVEDQLAHAVLVALDVDNTDTLAPKITVAPFGKKYLDLENEALKTNTVNVSSYEENIVMSGVGTAAKKEGYVQYAAHNGTSNSDISGKVIFLGKASDNQRIQNITVTIPGFNGGAAFTAAAYNSTTGKLVSVRETMGTGNNAWYFLVTSEHLTLDYGHVINWEFAWDSSELNYLDSLVNISQVGLREVTFITNDYRPASPTPTVSSDKISVNIVPYISEVVTSLSGAYKAQPSAFARSSTGYYPVRENETITVKGFNLGTNEATAANAITGVAINGTALTYSYNANPDTALAAGNFRVINKNEVRINVGATATSGDLSVLVGANVANAGRRIPSINNSTKKLLPGQTVDAPNEVNRVPYNWEPNRTNNDILTNDRKLYIWSVGSLFNIPTTGMQHPFMRMTRTGQRYLAYNTAVSNANLTLNINQTAYTLESTQNRYLNTTVAVDDNEFWYVGTSNQTAQANNYFAIHARGASSGNSTNAGTNKARVLNLGANTTADPAEADRVKIPRIFARTSGTNAANIANSYQNNFTKQINFHYGNFSGTAGTNNTNRLTVTGDFNAAPSTVQRVAQSTSTYPGDPEGSGFTAVGILSNGQPVVAWYTGKDLVMSYGHTGGTGVSGATEADTSNRWQLRATVVQAGFGSHVDMTVDAADNVHMAYYNANDGGLYYAFIPRSGIPTVTTADGGNTKITSIETVRVDTFLSAGTKIMISVRDETTGTVLKYVPYISYYHGSFSETKSAIRVAWPVTTVNSAGKMSVENGTDTSDMFTGKWEVMTVPVVETPSMAYIICNGVPRWRNNWALPVDSWGYYNGTASTANSRANRTILVGYLTGSRYEGAMLKADLFAGAPTGNP